MEMMEALKIMHPDTRKDVLRKIKFYRGFYGAAATEEAIKEACRMAAEAMSLQIAVAPVRYSTNYADENDWYDCPTCGSSYPIYDRRHFCDNCGQKLGWIEEGWKSDAKRGYRTDQRQ